MDGTLIDSAVDITSSINFVRSTLGLGPLTIENVTEAINSDQRNLAKIFYDKEVYEQRERDLFEAHYYDECIKNVCLYDEIRPLLERLKANGVRCSVATNAPSTFAKRMLGFLDVHHHFDYIFGADTHSSKPDPHMIVDILKNYGYDNAQDPTPLMVGDNLKDVKAGENAKIKSVHVTWGFADFEHENSINSPMELLKLLDIS